MREQHQNLTGIFVALPAPFDANEKFNPNVYKVLINDLVEAGVDGFLVNGSMGLQPLLDLDTFERAIEAASEVLEGKGRSFLVGCGDASYGNSMQKIRIAERYPVTHVSVTTPYYFSYTQEEIGHYFRRLAESTELGFVLYDNPDCTHNDIELRTILELSDLPNLRGIKISRADIHFIRKVHETFRNDERFDVICGMLHYMDLLVRDGIQAYMDGIWAMMPRLALEIFERANSGDRDEARQLIYKNVALLDFMVKLGLMPAYTAAMNIMGYEGNFAISPFSAPSGTVVEAMRNYLAEQEFTSVSPSDFKGREGLIR